MVDDQIKRAIVILESNEQEEKRNVHNKAMITLPLIALALGEERWIGGLKIMEDIWWRHLILPFSEHYDSNSAIFFKSIFNPVLLLLRVRQGPGGREEAIEEGKRVVRSCVAEGGGFGQNSVLERVMSLLGRSFKSIIGELAILTGEEREREWGFEVIGSCYEEANEDCSLIWEAQSCKRILTSSREQNKAFW